VSAKMKRREFISLGGAAAWPLAARASSVGHKSPPVRFGTKAYSTKGVFIVT